MGDVLLIRYHTDYHTRCEMTQIYTMQEVVDLLRRACVESGGQSAWATKNGVSPQFVNDVLQCRREPGKLITRALGLVENPRTWSNHP